jgi:hypothetical protein
MIPHISQPGSSPLIMDPLVTLQQQMQQILGSMSVMHSKMDNFISELNTVKERVTVVEGDMKNAFSEIYELKEQVNIMEQRERSLTIRVFGLPLSPEELEENNSHKAAAKTAYDRILRPILIVAKDNSLVQTVPVIANVISDAYRLKPKATSPAKPPPLVIKLVSHAIKVSLFKSKREATPKPSKSEVDSGIIRFHIAEDLTPATYEFLNNLRLHEKIERAWTTDGQVRYIKKGDSSGFVHKVKCIFDNIDTMLR